MGEGHKKEGKEEPTLAHLSLQKKMESTTLTVNKLTQQTNTQTQQPKLSWQGIIGYAEDEMAKTTDTNAIPTRWNTSRRALILACGPVL